MDEAVQYIMDEYGVTEEQARKMVKKITQDDDGNISRDQLEEVYASVKQK